MRLQLELIQKPENAHKHSFSVSTPPPVHVMIRPHRFNGCAGLLSHSFYTKSGCAI